MRTENAFGPDDFVGWSGGGEGEGDGAGEAGAKDDIGRVLAGFLILDVDGEGLSRQVFMCFWTI